MEEGNRALVQRFYDEVVSGGNVDLLDELCTPDFEEHSAPPELPPGREGFKVFVRSLRAAFPDFRWVVDDWVVAGDKVAARGHGRGTHEGDFFGVPGTGRSVSWTAIHIFRVDGGRLVERWSEADVMGIMEQLKGGT